jgi:hypothetical protein
VSLNWESLSQPLVSLNWESGFLNLPTVLRTSTILPIVWQGFLGVTAALMSIAMVRLVVGDVDAGVIEQLSAGPVEHGGIGFGGLDRLGRIWARRRSRAIWMDAGRFPSPR